MQENEGRLLFEVRADQTDIKKDIEAIKKQFESLTEKTKEEGKKQAEVWQNLVKGATAYFTLQGASAFIKQVVAVRSQFQQLEISFGTMLKSKEKANALMAQMTDLAAKTPFGLEEVSEGAKRLLAFQVPAEEVTETLRRMGDVAAGLGVPMGQLIHVYGQVKAQGKLMTNDLYQFMNAGIPIIAELSKVVGKSETEIKDMVSAGKIGFPEVQAVIKNMTNEGGLFFNLMAEQSKSLGGQISNLGDSFDQMLNDIGKASEGYISGAIQGVTFLVENYKTLGKVIAGLIVTYGAYRTAVLVNIALTKGWAVAAKEDAIAKGIQTVATNAATVATKALNAAMKANPYVLVATAVVGLVSAVVLFNKEMTVAEKAQKAYNEEQERQKGVLQKEREEYEQLIDVVKDENQSKGKRIEAFQKLQSLYPDIFSKYKTEEELIKNISKALKELNGVQKDRDLKMDQDYMQRLEMQKKALQSSLRTSANPAEIANIKEQIQSVDIQIEKARKQYNWQSTLNKIDSLAELSADDKVKERKLMIEEYNRRHNAKQAKNQNLLQEGEKKDIRKTSLPAVVATGYENFTDADLGLLMSKSQGLIDLDKERNKIIDTRNELLAKQKELAAKINAIQSKSGQTQNDKDELKKLQDEKEAIDKKLKGDYNEGKTKATKATKSAKSELPTFDYEKNKRDKERLEKDRMFEEDEAKIKAMKDGREKRNALLVLEYEKRAETIKRKGEDELQAFIETEKQKAEAEGKWKKGQDFNTDTPAIQEEKTRIAKNQEVLNQDNLDEYTRQQEAMYKELLEKYQTYTDQRKAIEEKYNADITALQAKLGADAPQVKKAQDEKARELKKLDILYKKEGTAIAKLFENMRKKTVKEIHETIADAEKEIDQLASILDMSDKDNVDYVQNLRQQLEQAKDTADRSDTVFGRLGTSIKNLFKAKPNTAEWQEAFNGVLSSAQSLSGAMKSFGSDFSKLGENAGNESLKNIGKKMEEVGNIIDKTLSGASLGASIGGGYGAAIGGVIGLATSLIMNDQKKMAERRAEYLNTQQQIVNEHREYNRLLTEEMLLMNDYKSIFGVKELSVAIGYMDIYLSQMEKFYASTKRNYEIRRTIGTFRDFDAGVPRNDRRGGDIDKVDNRSALERIEIKTASGYESISQYNLIKENGELNESLAESILKTREFKEGHKEALDQIISYYKEAKEAKKQFDEYLKSTFGELGNSIVDSVVKSLQTGEDAFESFAKSVGNVIGKLGKQLVYEIFVAERFKSFQKEIENVYKKGANKELTTEGVARESAKLVAQFGNSMKDNFDNMKNLYKSMNDLAKSYDPNFDFLNEQRKATEKGFARMSQDTGEELNGQFRLQTQLSAEIKNAMLQSVKEFAEMHKFMQTSFAQQLRHLAGIEANTFQLHEMKKDIANMKAGINELTTKGIKIRS
nr:MAG TPA: tail tape measure protein [Caudoviricetes sp.]